MELEGFGQKQKHLEFIISLWTQKIIEKGISDNDNRLSITTLGNSSYCDSPAMLRNEESS